MNFLLHRQRTWEQFRTVFSGRYPHDEALEAARQVVVRRIVISCGVLIGTIAIIAALAGIADHFGGFDTT